MKVRNTLSSIVAAIFFIFFIIYFIIVCFAAMLIALIHGVGNKGGISWKTYVNEFFILVLPKEVAQKMIRK